MTCCVSAWFRCCNVRLKRAGLPCAADVGNLGGRFNPRPFSSRPLRGSVQLQLEGPSCIPRPPYYLSHVAG